MFHKWRVFVAIKIKQEQKVRFCWWFFPHFSTMFPCLRFPSSMSEFFQKMLIKLTTFFDPCKTSLWVFQKAKSVNHKLSLFCLSMCSLSLLPKFIQEKGLQRMVRFVRFSLWFCGVDCSSFVLGPSSICHFAIFSLATDTHVLPPSHWKTLNKATKKGFLIFREKEEGRVDVFSIDHSQTRKK